MRKDNDGNRHSTLTEVMLDWIANRTAPENNGGYQGLGDWVADHINADGEYRIREAVVEPSSEQVGGFKCPVCLSEGMIIQLLPEPVMQRIRHLKNQSDANDIRKYLGVNSLVRLAFSQGQFIIWRMFWNETLSTTVMLGVFDNVLRHRPENPDPDVEVPLERNEGDYMCGFLLLDDISEMLLKGQVVTLGIANVD